MDKGLTEQNENFYSFHSEQQHDFHELKQSIKDNKNIIHFSSIMLIHMHVSEEKKAKRNKILILQKWIKVFFYCCIHCYT